MRRLNYLSTVGVRELAQPDEIKAASLSTPALNFLADYHVSSPLVIESSTPAVEARRVLEKSHVPPLSVVDEKGRFVGLVGAEDLQESRIVQQIAGGFSRADIRVTDLMRPARDLIALDFSELSRVTIGDVVAALKKAGQPYGVVLDSTDKKIRGIYSAADIAAKLHVQIEIPNNASFYKAFAGHALA